MNGLLEQSDPFRSLMAEPSLIAKCLITEHIKDSIRNALSFSVTSKIYYHIINSNPFFKDFATQLDPVNSSIIALLDSKKSESPSPEGTTFKRNYFEMRSLPLTLHEVYPGTIFGDATATEDGMEVFSFWHGIECFKLKENPASQSIIIPNEMRIQPRQMWREFPFVARSENFLVINQRSDSAIYIYSPCGKECLAKREVVGEICQLTLVGNLLCVVEQNERAEHFLVVFNLDLLSEQAQTPLSIALPIHEKIWPPPRPISFGKEHLIFTQALAEGNKIHALPMSCLQGSSTEDDEFPWLEGTKVEGCRYLFPCDNEFFEVIFKDFYICDITKISIGDQGFQKKTIAENILISSDEKTYRAAVCLHNDRLIIAYDHFCKGTKFFSYDMISGKVEEVFSMPESASNCPFKPRFYSVANKVYYLIMTLGTQKEGNSGTMQSDLLTLTYGKI